MKANTVRLLAGGLAATIIMTNMATMPVFADDSMNTVAPYECEVMESTEADTETAEEAEAEEEAAAEATEEAAEEAEAEMSDAEETETAEAEEAQGEEAQPVSEDADLLTEEAAEEPEQGAALTEEAADKPASEDADLLTEEEVEEPVLGAALTEEEAKEPVLGAALTEEEAKEPVLGAAPAEANDAAKTETKTEAKSENHKLTLEEAKAEAKRIETEVNDLGDVMKLLISQDTTKMLPELSKAAAKAKAAAKMDAPGDPEDVLIYNYMRSAYSAALEKAFNMIPYVKCVSAPLKNLVLDMLGFNNENYVKKPVTLDDRIEETNTKIDEAKGEIKRSIETVNSINNYGTRLDTFTNSTAQLEKAMEKIKEDSDLSENEKAVKIAALLGNASEWAPGKASVFKEMTFAAQVLSGQADNGPKTDVKARNLFELFYDYNRETSMFSGEAMDKANPAIQKRVNEYVANCSILTEVLRAHEKVANLSEDEVKELRHGTGELYNTVKSDTKDIRMQMRDIIETFAGDKNSKIESARCGILEAADKYYSKNRLLYIDRNGDQINEIKFAPKLYTQKSEQYSGKALREKSAINESQVKALQQHVNSLGFTMADYLANLGFDMKDVKDSNRLMLLSTLHDEVKRPIIPGAYIDNRRYYAIDMNKKEAAEKRYLYYSRHEQERCGSTKKSDPYFSNAIVAAFMTQAKVNEEWNKQAEEEFTRHMEECKKMLVHPPTQPPRQNTWVDKALNFIKSIF